jgi:hypothetical protein
MGAPDVSLQITWIHEMTKWKGKYRIGTLCVGGCMSKYEKEAL